jgi:hypothetical protein
LGISEKIEARMPRNNSLFAEKITLKLGSLQCVEVINREWVLGGDIAGDLVIGCKGSSHNLKACIHILSVPWYVEQIANHTLKVLLLVSS